MFVIRTVSPVDILWEERESVIMRVAGRKADLSTTSSETGRKTIAIYEWKTKTFLGAIKMRLRLERIRSVRATIREYTSPTSGVKKAKK